MNGSFADWNPLEDNSTPSVPDVSNIVLPVPGAGQPEPSYIVPEANVPNVSNPTPEVETTVPLEEQKNILPGTPGIELLSTSSLLNTNVEQTNANPGEVPVNVNPNPGDVPININPGEVAVNPNPAIPVSQGINPNQPAPAVEAVPTPVENTTLNPFAAAPTPEVEILSETQNLAPVVEEVKKEEKSTPLIDPTLPNTNGIQMENMNPEIRYNPVTGEEMNINDVINATKKDEVDVSQDKELKRVEIGKKIKSTWNSLLLLLLFGFLIVFVLFLPEVQTTVSNFFSGKKAEYVETIPTGKLVCTLETSSSNLDRSIERIFQYEQNKVKSGKFTTIVRGDITLDESALDLLNEQCNKVKDKVSGLEGVSISCNYENGRLEEKETFDYKTYSMEDVSTAYFDAGSSLVEIEYQEDIDHIMTLMRQGGFTCNKEK